MATLQLGETLGILHPILIDLLLEVELNVLPEILEVESFGNATLNFDEVYRVGRVLCKRASHLSNICTNSFGYLHLEQSFPPLWRCFRGSL